MFQLTMGKIPPINISSMAMYIFGELSTYDMVPCRVLGRMTSLSERCVPWLSLPKPICNDQGIIPCPTASKGLWIQAIISTLAVFFLVMIRPQDLRGVTDTQLHIGELILTLSF
jgi:hypothetical protein